MTWQTAKPWVGTAARLILGVVFFWASLAKLHNPRTFVQTVRAYDATPEWLSKAIGYGLPVLELAVGLMLIVGVAVKLTSIVAGSLLVIFIIGVLQASARGIKLDCGCFGGGGTTVGGTSYILDVLRDIGLLALAVYLVLYSMTLISVEQFLARNDTVVVPSAKRLRDPQGMRKYQAQLAVIEADAKSRSRYLNASLALITVLVVIIGIGVQANRAKVTGDLVAANASQTNGIVFGKKAAATIDVYEDLGCPICENFEKSVHTTLEKDVRANLAQLRYHPISILDRNSKNQYSTRAANAVLCASDISVDAFVAYHDILYGTLNGKQVQPTEGTSGPTDLQLVGYGKTKSLGWTSAQVSTFSTCVTSHEHKALVAALTEKSSERGVTGTPTVYVNGKQVTASLSALEAAIKSADAKGPKPVPSVTPSPTPTPTPTATPSGSASATPSSSPAKSPTASKSS